MRHGESRKFDAGIGRRKLRPCRLEQLPGTGSSTTTGSAHVGSNSSRERQQGPCKGVRPSESGAVASVGRHSVGL